MYGHLESVGEVRAAHVVDAVDHSGGATIHTDHGDGADETDETYIIDFVHHNNMV